MRNREDLKPTITDTVFVENHAARAMGGALLWTASDATMIQQDLLPLIKFQEQTGFARGNDARSGPLIASTAQHLAILQGPTSQSNRSHGKKIATTKITNTSDVCIAGENSQCITTTQWIEWETGKNKTWDQLSWEEPSETDVRKQPFVVNILDYYGNLATTSGSEDKITIRSVTERSITSNCLPADGKAYDNKTGICHFDDLGNEKSAVNGVVTFSEYKIKALPTEFTNSLYNKTREDTGPLKLEFLLKLDDRGSRDKWLARAKIKLHINNCKTGDYMDPTTRKCEPVDAAGFFASNVNHNLWLLQKVTNMDEPNDDGHNAIENSWLDSKLEDWNASCPVGTFGKKDRRGPNDIYFGNTSISPQRARATCALCPAGWFSDGIRRGECTTCPSGFFGNFSGMGRCRACPEGKFIRAKGEFTCEGDNCNDVYNRLACHSCPSGRYREAPLRVQRCTGNHMNLYGAGGPEGTKCHVWSALSSVTTPKTYACGDHTCVLSGSFETANAMLHCNSSDARILEGTVLQLQKQTGLSNLTYLATVKLANLNRESKTSMDIKLMRREGTFSEIARLATAAKGTKTSWSVTCVSHSWPVSGERKDCSSCPAGYWTAGSEGNGACHACPAGKYGPHNQKMHPDKRHYGTCLNCSMHEYNPEDRAENSENVTKGDPSLTACGQCYPGTWTSRTFDGQIKEQWDSITNNMTKEICKTHCFDDDKEKCLRYEWRESIGECVKLVSESFVDTVKENDNGTSYCYPCKRGEVLSLDKGCERCASSARGPADETSGTSGTYSFHAGESGCKKCPFGALCYNGDSIDAGWGWWMSGGTAAGRANLQQKLSRARSGGLANTSTRSSDLLNEDLCPFLHDNAVELAADSEKDADKDNDSLDLGVCGDYKCSFGPDANSTAKPALRCTKTASSTQIVPQTVLQLRMGSNYTYRATAKRTMLETETSVIVELSHHKGILKELQGLYDVAGGREWSVTCVESFECEALCSDVTEDGCACFETSKASTKSCKSRSKECTCRRTCKQSTDTPWHSTFFDACGSQRKMIRCKGYREEEACGEIQMQALRDGYTLFDEFGIAYKEGCSFSDEEFCDYMVLPMHCQSCRSTQVISAVPVFKRGYENNNSSNSSLNGVRLSEKTFTENITENLERVGHFEVEYALAGSLTSHYRTTIVVSVNMSILEKLHDAKHEANGIRREHAHSHCNVLNGYGGRRCAACLEGYSKSGIESGCFRCDPDWLTWIKVIALPLCAFVIVVVFIFIIMQGAGSDKKTGAVQKILLNYLQMLGTIGTLPIKWPTLMKEGMIGSGSLTMAGEIIFPIDCLLPHDISEVFVKQTILSMLPIVSISLNALWWGGKKWCRKRRHKKQGIAELHHMEVPKIIARRHQQRLKGLRAEILSGFAQSKLQTGQKMGMSTFVLSEMGHAHMKEVERLTAAVRSGQHTNSSHGHLSRHGLSMDEQATATLHAREFMAYCHDKHVDLHALWREYDHDGSGDITTAQFETICRDFGFTWTDDEFTHLLMLFDGSNADGYVDLATLIQFSRNFWEKFVLSTVTIGVLLYPTLVVSFFKMLACERDLLDGEHKDDMYLMADLEVVCFRGLHLDYVLGIGIPVGLLYVIGMPLYMLLLMHHVIKHVDTEHHDSVQYRFGILMAGFKEKHYAWEILVTVRKAIMSLIATFGIVLGPDGQLYFAILAIGFFICVHVANTPYHGNMLNNLELWNLLIVFISLYFGILFLLEKIENDLAMPVAITLLCLQGGFVLYCVFHIIEDGNIFRKKSNTVPAKAIKKVLKPAKVKVTPTDRLKKKVNLVGLQMTAKNRAAVRREAQLKLQAEHDALATAKREAQLKIEADLDALADTELGSELPARIKALEASCVEAESVGLFDKEGTSRLEFSARELERAKMACKTMDDLLLNAEAFNKDSFSLLWMKKRPPHGVLEVLECLVAALKMDEHTPLTLACLKKRQKLSASKRETSIKERWVHIGTVLKTLDDFNDLQLRLQQFNPFKLGEELAACIGMIIANVDPPELVRRSAVCGDILIYLASVVSLSTARRQDVATREEDRAEMAKKETDRGMMTTVVDWSDTEEMQSSTEDGDGTIDQKEASDIERHGRSEEVRRVANWEFETKKTSIREAPLLAKSDGGAVKETTGKYVEEAIDATGADAAIALTVPDEGEDSTVATADADASVKGPGNEDATSGTHSEVTVDLESPIVSQPDTSLLDGALSDASLSESTPNDMPTDMPRRHTSVLL
jgi:hypothetical protein